MGELDNRGSHFYLAMYWARAIVAQEQDPDLAAQFIQVANALEANEGAIVAELNEAQGSKMNLAGYYMPDTALATKAMRPSETLNTIIESI